jgi:hypothetical protein
MAYEIELEAGGLEFEVKGWRGLLTLTGIALVGAAVVRELRLPPEQRTWHGVLFGRIPYDLRMPTVGRVVNTLWDPNNRHVLVPTAFGVGWSLNVAALLGPVRQPPVQA